MQLKSLVEPVQFPKMAEQCSRKLQKRTRVLVTKIYAFLKEFFDTYAFLWHVCFT